MNNLPAILLLEGDVVREVLISPEDMARMNDARATFKELYSILMGHVIPELGGFNNPVATEIERRLESIMFDSRNFLWPHRYTGAAHAAVNVGGVQ
ncbi:MULTISPECIES: hypothetical protein [Pseudomonas]|uniref:hypothetical protein n=1 Tax=Pseudomonas TaxID=286 RepID=UPI0018E7B3CC|nr:hypothetical protein [Pseudomonas carnis]MBJ2211277.1 hypothetical protein [Pseudomonas carnis]